MHLVELKGITRPAIGEGIKIVPNVPCGVERYFKQASFMYLRSPVPNAPCGIKKELSETA